MIGVVKAIQLQTAKAKLSQLVNECIDDGPRPISRRREIVAYLVSRDDYEAMQGNGRRANLRKFEAGLEQMPMIDGNPVLEDRR